MYCRNCGNQLPEEASVCPSCGSLVNEIAPIPAATTEVQLIEPAPVVIPEVQRIEPATKQRSKAQKIFYKLSYILTKIGLIMNAVIFGCLVIALLLYAFGVVSGGLLVSSISFSLASLCAEISLIGFVFSLIQKVEPKQRRTSIPVFVVSLVFAIVSYIAYYVGEIIVGIEYYEYLAEYFEGLMDSFYNY